MLSLSSERLVPMSSVIVSERFGMSSLTETAGFPDILVRIILHPLPAIIPILSFRLHCSSAVRCRLGVRDAIDPSAVRPHGLLPSEHHWATAAALCSVGYACPNTSSQILCASGTFCPQGSVKQTLCPAGFVCADPTGPRRQRAALAISAPSARPRSRFALSASSAPLPLSR